MCYIKGVTQLLNEPMGFVYISPKEVMEQSRYVEVDRSLRKMHRINEQGVLEETFVEATGMNSRQLKRLINDGFLIRVYRHSKVYILRNKFFDMLISYLKKRGNEVKEFKFEKLKYCKQKVK